MAISKLILNGEVQMDVTSDTVMASSLLSGKTATKNDGTKITGNIASKSSDDLTASGATVTAPAGYYANAASKAVATTTHPNPSASITSSTGVVTASHTQGTGYVTGGTTTGTLNLTTQAGKTVTPTETAQTAVVSYRWTTGNVNVAAISSTYVGTGVTTRSAADMTVAAQSVTAPAGYYSQAFTKAVTTTTHPNPTAAIASSTGVVTATHTQTTGYVTSGTTTGTLNLTTQAAQTINTSTADQTIASNRWLTGAQTIKSVTTTNLTAANIAEGVVVKVGDANNASRITQITGTYSGATSYTATISGSGNSSYCYVTYDGTKRYTNGNTFTFKAGDTLTIYCRGNNASVNGDKLTLSSYSYTYTLPVGDITINLSYSSSTSNSIVIYGLIKPTGDLSITASGTHNTYKYSTATVAAGSAFPPAVTITKAPTIGVNTSGVVTASYNGSSSITPTVTSGYVSQGTAGTISTTGTSTYQLTSKAAATYYPSTADQTIASQRWLVGNQTIKSVTTSNLTAANIVEGVTVKVGDSSNASRITQVTGTYAPEPTYTATISGSGNGTYCYVTYSGNKYYSNNQSFTFKEGDTLTIHCSGKTVKINKETIEVVNSEYTYTLPVGDINIALTYASTQFNSIIISGLIDVNSDPIYTATMNGSSSSEVYITYKGIKYDNNVSKEFTYKAGETCVVTVNSYNSNYPNTKLIINGETIIDSNDIIQYTYTLPNKDISIFIYIGINPGNSMTITESTIPSGILSITSNAKYNVYGYEYASVDVADLSPSTFNVKLNGFTSSIWSIKYQSSYWSTPYNNYTMNAGDSITVFNNSNLDIPFKYDYYNVGTISAGSSFDMPLGPIAMSIEAYSTWFSVTMNYSSATTYIGDALYTHYWSSNVSVTVPERISLLGNGAFYSIDALQSIGGNNVTGLGNYCFERCNKLITVNFPKVLKIGNHCFESCRALTAVDFPEVGYIGDNAFYSCSSLSSVNFPKVVSIGSSCFQSCSQLTSVNFPLVSSIGAYAFCDCSQLSTVIFPKIQRINVSAFNGCHSLANIDLTNATYIGSNAFQYCSALTHANIPNVLSIMGSTFSNCWQLSVVSLSAVSSIYGLAFARCYRLLSVYLFGSSVPVLATTTVFSSTPISGYTANTEGVHGSIFVPASLYDSYITATNWSIYSARIVSM